MTIHPEPLGAACSPRAAGAESGAAASGSLAAPGGPVAGGVTPPPPSPGPSTPAQVRKHALLSKDNRYRYWLTRAWGDGPLVTFVMLNPSTADAEQDDPTIRRCMGYARAWGYDGITVVNLYALRSTDPRQLWSADDPVGPLNDQYIITAASRAALDDAPIVAAWGANARPDRVSAIRALRFMERLSALALTKDGAGEAAADASRADDPVPAEDDAAFLAEPAASDGGALAPGGPPTPASVATATTAPPSPPPSTSSDDTAGAPA